MKGGRFPARGATTLENLLLIYEMTLRVSQSGAVYPIRGREKKMSYVIRYFKDGEEQGSTPPGTLEAMKKIAISSLSRHGMDCAVITDPAGNVVWASVNHVTETRRLPAHLIAALRVFGRRLAR